MRIRERIKVGMLSAKKFLGSLTLEPRKAVLHAACWHNWVCANHTYIFLTWQNHIKFDKKLHILSAQVLPCAAPLLEPLASSQLPEMDSTLISWWERCIQMILWTEPNWVKDLFFVSRCAEMCSTRPSQCAPTWPRTQTRWTRSAIEQTQRLNRCQIVDNQSRIGSSLRNGKTGNLPFVQFDDSWPRWLSTTTTSSWSSRGPQASSPFSLPSSPEPCLPR